MKFIFSLFIVFCASQAMAGKKLAIGYRTGCAILDEGLRCWSDGKTSTLRNPENLGLRFVNPTQISFEEYSVGNMCVVDQGRLICWNDEGIKETTKLPGKIKIAGFGRDNNCHLLEKSIVCSGSLIDNEKGSIPVQDGKSMSMRWGYFCFIDGTSLQCRSSNDMDLMEMKAPPRPLKNPREVVAGNGGICALDDLGWQCWSAFENQNGYRTDADKAKVPARLKDIHSVAMGDQVICGIKNGQVHCWGSDLTGLMRPPKFVNAREVAISGKTACALDDKGVTCWGEGYTMSAWEQAQEGSTEITSGFGYLCSQSPAGLACIRNLNTHISQRADTPFSSRFDYIDDKTEPSIVPGVSKIYPTPDEHTPFCGIRDGQFTCWGFVAAEAVEKFFPASYRPSAFRVGSKYATPSKDNRSNIMLSILCGIEDGRLTCMSTSGEKIQIPKEIKQPVDVFPTEDSICVADAKGIFCWGSEFGGLEGRRYSDMQGLRKVMVWREIICGMNAEEVRCFPRGQKDSARENALSELSITGLKNARSLESGTVGWHQYSLCAIDDVGMKCAGKGTWLTSEEYMRDFRRLFGQPIGFARASGYDPEICTLYRSNSDGKNRVHCQKPFDMTFEKLRQSPAREWSSLGGERFSIAELDKRYFSMSREVTPVRAWLLKNFAEYLEKQVPNCVLFRGIGETRPECRQRFAPRESHSVLATRILALKLMGGLILSGDSKRYDEQYIPQYREALAQISGFLQARGVDFDRGARSTLERKLILKTMQLTLTLAYKRLLRPTDAKEAMNVLKAVAVAMPAPDDQVRMQALKKAYAANTKFRQALLSGLESSFVATIMDQAMAALK